MNYSSSFLKQNKEKVSGFTLAEMVFVMAILGVVTLVLTRMMIDTGNILSLTVNKSEITRDIRLFALELSNEAIGANYAYLYSTADEGDRDEASDKRQTDQSGDCLVLVYTEKPLNPALNESYERIVVYYRKPNAQGVSQVFRRDLDFTPNTFLTDAFNEFEDFLTLQWPNLELQDEEVVLEKSRGLSNNKLFYFYSDHTFVINGEIIHGKNSHTITNTHSLTISTRG